VIAAATLSVPIIPFVPPALRLTILSLLHYAKIDQKPWEMSPD